MDSENQLAMNLGETYLVTEKGNERLGKQKLDLVILKYKNIFIYFFPLNIPTIYEEMLRMLIQ